MTRAPRALARVGSLKWLWTIEHAVANDPSEYGHFPLNRGAYRVNRAMDQVNPGADHLIPVGVQGNPINDPRPTTRFN